MLGFKFMATRPTDHVVLYKSGRKAREGAGLGGLVFTPTATAAAVPMDSRDDFFSVETMTADYQTVTIQGLITFRTADTALFERRGGATADEHALKMRDEAERQQLEGRARDACGASVVR